MAGLTGGGNDTSTTALQNLVIAFNSVNKTLQYLGGQLTSNTYPAGGLDIVRIYHGRGRIVRVVLLEEGGEVDLYDSSESTVIPASSRKFSLNTDDKIGVYEVGVEVTNGIVLVVSGSSEVNVTYSVY